MQGLAKGCKDCEAESDGVLYLHVARCAGVKRVSRNAAASRLPHPTHVLSASGTLR